MKNIIKEIKEDKKSLKGIFYYIDSDLLKKFKAKCKKNGISQNKVIVKLVELFLKEN